MPDIKTKDNLARLAEAKAKLGSFSDINDDIIIKEDGNFQVFSHGDFSDLDISKLERKEKFSDSKELLDTGMEEINLAPPAPTIWDKKSNFYFDAQDEDDIAQETKKIEKMYNLSKSSQDKEIKRYSLSKILKKLLENYNLNLLPDLEKKLGNIVLSFLKNTRTKIDVLNLFKVPINQSGLGLDSDSANKLIDLLDNIKLKIDEVGGVVIEDQKEKSNDSQKRVENLSNIDPRQKIISEMKKASMPIVNRMSVSHNRPTINDIKKKERVIGPIDEFSEITLTMFRRLSDDSNEAAQKIIDKIRALEKESYLKSTAAIQNWRKSEVYRLYLDLGRESMEKNLSIDKIIEQKVLNKEKVLTKKEFSTITDLNKKLRF